MLAEAKKKKDDPSRFVALQEPPINLKVRC